MSNKLVTGLFQDPSAARNAVNELLSKGFQTDDISVLMSETTRKNAFAVKEHTKASEGAAIGAVAGGVAGATLAAIAATASIAIPGIGLLVAGPLIAALAGAGTVGAAGTLVGALIGLGFPEHEAKFVEKGLENGGILIGVQTTSGNVALAKDILRRYGGNALKAA